MSLHDWLQPLTPWLMGVMALVIIAILLLLIGVVALVRHAFCKKAPQGMISNEELRARMSKINLDLDSE